MEPLVLSYEERECALRGLRKLQSDLDSEMFRLTELGKTNSAAANAREIVALEFGCVTNVISKLWRLHAT